MNIFPYKISINKKHQYCCYLTIYSGELLPPFYFGSTKVERVKNGYHGSVCSKKWGNIYKQEKKDNPHLFKTIILKTTYNRTTATAVEYFLQKKNNVVKSSFFFNEALAAINGMFGRDTSGANHPLFGVGHSPEACKKIKDNHADCSGENNANFGNKYKVETKKRISDAKLTIQENGKTAASNTTNRRIEKEGKHWNTFKVKIYNDKKELIFHDYLCKIIEDNPILPNAAFRKSFNRGTPLPQTLGIQKKEWQAYRGWYAIKQ